MRCYIDTHLFIYLELHISSSPYVFDKMSHLSIILKPNTIFIDLNIQRSIYIGLFNLDCRKKDELVRKKEVVVLVVRI